MAVNLGKAYQQGIGSHCIERWQRLVGSRSCRCCSLALPFFPLHR